MTEQHNEDRRISRIPEFDSYEEEAEWFDTHDMADFQDEFKPVKVHFVKNLSDSPPGERGSNPHPLAPR